MKSLKLIAIIGLVAVAGWFVWKAIAKAMLKADVAKGRSVNPNAQADLDAERFGPADDVAAQFGLTVSEAKHVMAAYALGTVDGTFDGLVKSLNDYVATYGSLRKLDGSLGYGAG